MNKYVIGKQFIAAVANMRKTHDVGTYYWYLGCDGKNDWAIVLGWGDGFEPDPSDDCTDGTWRICAKLAYQSINSIMQCCYDIDWLMPYDKVTGEVDDNEVSIYPDTDLPGVVDWLFECYAKYDVLNGDK